MANGGKNLLKFVPNFTTIDLETTGRSNKSRDITEVSAVKYRNYKKVDSLSFLIKPENTILPYVVSLTGITDEMVENAPHIDDVIERIVAFIGDDIILGHNVAFDYNLVSEAIEYKRGYGLQNDMVDTLRISRLILQDIENHKLETLCRYFDVERKVGHRALEDCEQTSQVYISLKDRFVMLKEQKQKETKFYERI